MDRNTLLDLIPAYALGALDPDERAEFESLLAADAEAQKLLAEYQALSDDLVLVTPARPAPAHLGTDLRARLAASRANQPAKPDAPAPQPVSPPPIQVASAPRKVSRMPSYALAAAAAFVIIVGAALLFSQMSSRVPDDPAERYQWIVSQADYRSIPITPVASEATGELVLTADGQYGVIQVSNLPEIPSDRTFQMWLIDPEGAQSGGLLDDSQALDTNFINLPLEKPIDEYNAFGMSIEPDGGSPNPDGPTGERVFGVQV